MKNSARRLLLPHSALRTSHFSLPSLAVAVITLLHAPTALAWDYEGHRAINLAALSAMPPDFPSFLKTPAATERIAHLSGEPDRWYNSAIPSLRHINAGDHFFDIEELAPLGLKFADLPQFRYIFIQQLARAQAAHPEIPPKIDPAKDKDATGTFPGFLPWAIAENYAKLQSAFSTLRAYEQHGGTPAEIANARENVLYIMGVMGHYVGDSVQPLHLTIHYNGWDKNTPNPNNYTTSRRMHSWIDGGFLAKAGPIDHAVLQQRLKPATLLLPTLKKPPAPAKSAKTSKSHKTSAAPAPDPKDPAARDPLFLRILAHMQQQHATVAQLYALDKAGGLDAESPAAKEGRAFLENQLATGAKFLADLWFTAYKTAPDDKYLITQLERRNAAQ